MRRNNDLHKCYVCPYCQDYYDDSELAIDCCMKCGKDDEVQLTVEIMYMCKYCEMLKIEPQEIRDCQNMHETTGDFFYQKFKNIQRINNLSSNDDKTLT